MAKPIKITILGDSSSVERALGRTERGLSDLGGKIGGFAARAGAAIGAAGVAIGTAAGVIGLKTAAGLEQAEIGFTTLLGSGEKAKAFMNDLAAFAAKTPFDLPSLQSAAMRLTSVGMEASRVIPIMGVLGDATAAMGTGAEGVERATMALQQMAIKGKVSGEEMLQLAEAGVPAWDALAAALGVSGAEAQKMVSEGKVSVEQLYDALESRSGEALQRVSGMMDAQSASLSGLWSTLVDIVSVGLAKALGPVIPLIKDGLGGAISAAGPALESLGQAMASAVAKLPALVDGARDLAADVLPMLKAALESAPVQRFADAAKRLWDTLAPLAQQAFPHIVTVAKTLAVVLGATLYVAADVLSRVFDGLSRGVEWLVTNWSAVVSTAGTVAKVLGVVGTVIAVGLIPSAIMAGQIMLATARHSMTAAAAQARAWVTARVAAVTGAAASWAAGMRIVAGWVAQAAAATANGVRIAAVWTAQVVASAVTGAAAFAAQVGRVVAGWVLMGTQSLLQAARMAAAWVIAMGPIGWIIAAVVAVVALIIANWDKVSAWTQQAWSAVSNAVSAAWDTILGVVGRVRQVASIIGDAFNAARDWAMNALKGLLSFVAGVPGRIMDVFSGAGSWLADAGRKIIDGLKRGIEGAIEGVRRTLSRVTDLIPDWKGPEDVDRRLLTPAGESIMGGLIRGIEGALPALKSTLTGVTDLVNTSVTPTVAVAPSPVSAAGARTATAPVVREGDRYEVNVNVNGTNASPRDVGDEVVWALKTAGR